jgi:hypothetical protein
MTSVDYWRPRISPDGTRVAVEVLTPNLDARLWIVDLQRRTSTPLGGGLAGYVAWTPDGESVIYRRPDGLYRQAADGSLAAQLLLESPAGPASPWMYPATASSPSRWAARRTTSERFGSTDGAVSDFLATPAREHMASFSPDGRWLAYTSNESGQDEVYVRPFPRTEGVARLVSIGGGSGPVWAPDGSALYYRGASGDIMAVPTTLDPTFTAGRPQPLFRFAGTYRMSGTAAAYDIHPDGERFIMVSEPENAGFVPSRQIHVVLNWTEELKRLAPLTR